MNAVSNSTSGRAVSDRAFILITAISVSGFITAALSNLWFPQVAAVKITPYAVFDNAATLDFNQAYRLVLLGLILLYVGIAIFSWSDPDRRKRFKKRAPFRFAAGLALALWDILGTKLLILPQPFFPGPARIVEAFLMEHGYILRNTLYSLRLFAAGFILGTFFGVCTGVLIGWFPRVYYWVQPVLKVSGVIPAVAWMPFALTMFPKPFYAAVFLIVVCMWFPVATLTAAGISSTPKVFFEAARTMGAKNSYMIFRVAIPHAMPSIFTGIGTATAFAFLTLVMAEMMGQPGGLGYYINASRVWSAYYKVFAAILVMAVLFSAIMYLIWLVEARVLRWRKGLVRS